MVELMVIADDFTGAMDTGVQFSKFGISTMVVLSRSLPENFQVFDEDVEVLVVDTESRHIKVMEAYREVYEAAGKAVRNGVRYIYKKVDSTMRGNIGGELEAVLKGSGFPDTPLILAPAFPRQGRYTREGIQYIGEKPVAETEFAGDPFTPVTESYIPDIVRKQSAVLTESIKAEQLDEAIQEGGERILVVDAETDNDLCRIAKKIRRQGKKHLLMAGNAGFAAKLPQILRFHVGELSGMRQAEQMLVVCGSLNMKSQEQIRMAERAGIKSVTLTKEQKRDSVYFSGQKGLMELERWGQLLGEQGSLIIKMSEAEEVSRILQTEQRMNSTEHLKIAGNVGAMVAALLRKSNPGALTVFGGDTLYGIVSNMKSFGIKPQIEIFPGVVQSELDFEGTRILAVTKAGGFGETDTLVRILEYYGLKEEEDGGRTDFKSQRAGAHRAGNSCL